MKKYWKNILLKKYRKDIFSLITVLLLSVGSVIQISAQVDANTLLSLRFENSLNGEQGEMPTQASGITFQGGIQGQGALFGNPNQVFYQSANIVNALEGTFEFWIKPTWNGNDGQHHTVFQWSDGQGVLITKDSANNLKIIANRFGTNPGGETAFNTSSWLANQWHHVAFTYSAAQAQVKIYIDGQLKNTNNFAGLQPGTLSNTLQLGGIGQDRYINAVLDNFVISNIARTPQEIASRFISALTITSLTATPTTIQLLPTWWKAPTLQANTNIGTINIPAATANWSSSNPTVASFDYNRGKIIANSAGTAILTATVNGVTANITVTVTAPVLQPTVETISPYLSTPNANALWEIPVVIINYLPTTDGINLNSQVTGETSTLVAMRERINRINLQHKFMLEEGSRFRAFNNSLANPSLGYRVISIVTVYEELLPLDSTCDMNGVCQPDYEQILMRFNSRNLVNNLGVKEFWIWGYHQGNISPVESNMSSPTTGDISNSYRLNDLPVHNKTYVLYNYNFGRTASEATHNHGHQLEAILGYSNQRQDGNDNLFWEKFVGRVSGTRAWQRGRAGDTHHPPNALNDYDYSNTTPFASDIADWNPNGGTNALVNLSTWRNISYPWIDGVAPPQDDAWWYIYWMQSMPGRGNQIPYNSNRMTNWWQFTGDWDAAIRAGIGLYEPASCSYSLSSNNGSFAATGGTGSITVSSTTGCKWFASSNAPFVALTSGDTSNNGNTVVNFSVSPNTINAVRTTKLIVAGQIFTINQAASQAYEADVFSRPNGDGFVDSDDIQQIRRFALGLDAASLGGEYQRADCSFRNTLGDGYIDSDDVVQARRYALGLDNLQLAGGPSSSPPIAPPVSGNAPADDSDKMLRPNDNAAVRKTGKIPAVSAALRVDSQNIRAGQTLVVPIRIDTVGDEAGYTFSLNYDASRLTDPQVAIGNAGGDVIFNANNPGQIGFSVTSFNGGTIAAGTDQVLVNVTFTTVANAEARATPIIFTDTIARRKASGIDPNNPITQPTYTGGTITIGGAAAPTDTTISGRVVTANGRGIGNVIVTLTDANGSTRTAATTLFGYYRFADVPAGQTYIISAAAKRYKFGQPTRILNLNVDDSEIDFVAIE